MALYKEDELGAADELTEGLERIKVHFREDAKRFIVIYTWKILDGLDSKFGNEICQPVY